MGFIVVPLLHIDRIQQKLRPAPTVCGADT